MSEKSASQLEDSLVLLIYPLKRSGLRSRIFARRSFLIPVYRFFALQGEKTIHKKDKVPLERKTAAGIPAAVHNGHGGDPMAVQKSAATGLTRTRSRFD